MICVNVKFNRDISSRLTCTCESVIFLSHSVFPTEYPCSLLNLDGMSLFCNSFPWIPLDSVAVLHPMSVDVCVTLSERTDDTPSQLQLTGFSRIMHSPWSLFPSYGFRIIRKKSQTWSVDYECRAYDLNLLLPATVSFVSATVCHIPTGLRWHELVRLLSL